MSGCSISLVLQLQIVAYEVADCSDSCGNLVPNQMWNPEYEVKDEFFPNNMAVVHNERQQFSSII